MKRLKKFGYSLIFIIVLLFLFNTKIFAASVPEIKNKYPTGMQWNDSYHGWTECAGFAALMYEEYYGLNPIKYASQTKDPSQIKAGDIVRYNGHSVWVTARNGDALTIAECNYDWNNHVRWDQTRYISNISGSLEYIMQAPWAIGTTPPPLESPTSASVDTSDGVKISWNKVEYSTGYQIKIYNSKNEIVKDFESTNLGGTYTNVFGLATDSYTVRIYAKRYDTLSSNYATASFSCHQEASRYVLRYSNCFMVEKGTTSQYKLSLYPSDGAAECYFYNGSLTDTNIATVDRDGNVTGISEGETYVYVYFRTSQTTSKRAYKVIVTGTITFKENTKTLQPGDTYNVIKTSMPNNYSRTGWSSSDSNVAIVDENGKVTALAEGTTKIRCFAQIWDSDKKQNMLFVDDICEVTVRVPKPDVEIQNATNLASINTHTFSSLSETLQLKAKLSNNESTNYTWKSSNEKVLKVDQNGKVTPVAGGFADITVTDSKYGKIAKCNCYVQVPVTLSDGSKAYVGDMDRNGYFNAVDTSMILDAFNNGASADQILLGDINGDGMVNAVDSAFINDLYTSNRFSPGNYYKIAGVTLNKTETTIKKGNSENLKATINPSNTTDSPKITWSSSNENIAIVDNNGKVTAKSKGTATITAKTSNGKTAICKVNVVENSTPSVKYRTHVQKEGWQDFVTDGETSGTSGKSLRLEGIKIEIEGPISGGIKYSTHVQKEGWQEFAENGALSGTTGKGLRLEAIKIELTGDIASKYDVYYRVHAQKFGWMGWAKNGEAAGTQGYGYRLEGVQIKLVKKGEEAPTSSALVFSICPTLKYASYVQKEGWNEAVNNGQVSGTTGKGLRMEAFNITLRTYGITGGIKYTAHVQKQGWQNYVTNGEVAGTTGNGLRMEAIKIELTEEIAEKFDIYYRVHAEKFGWMGWAKNGEAAGTQGYGYRIEAMQIQLLPKGSKPSGSIENAFVKK